MAINLKFPMRFDSINGLATNNTTVDAVVSDLKILLSSNWGSRPIHYNYGANLRSIMFEQTSGVLTKAEDLVLTAIDQWMPFVEVLEINAYNDTVDSTLNPNEIRVVIKFSVGQIEGALDHRIKN